jgi:hypothetical protein
MKRQQGQECTPALPTCHRHEGSTAMTGAQPIPSSTGHKRGSNSGRPMGKLGRLALGLISLITIG